MLIPYGVADFKTIRDNHLIYIDKSRYIRELELGRSSGRYVAWFRPRRFGKSLLLSMLTYYYDVRQADPFESLFGGLEIAQNPTPEKNSYLILRLEFTGLNGRGSADALESDFLTLLRSALTRFIYLYQPFWPRLEQGLSLLAKEEGAALAMRQILELLTGCPYKLYVFIDEYDNFTNDLVFRGRYKTYEQVLHGAGFMREFFKVLKDGTSTGTVGRIFITGVSPVTIDDLGSGANIFTYLSLNSSVEAMCGFTEAEVMSLLRPRLAELGQPERLEELMQTLRFFYNGYHFAQEGREGIFNPDMLLFFLRELKSLDVLPQYMLDENLRMDYGKLRALMVGNQALPRHENVQTLLEVVSTGGKRAQLERTFPLTQAWEPRYFASLLFYHGLLTLEPSTGKLVIPNFVIRQLLWENLRDMLNEVCEAPAPGDKLEQVLQTLATEGDVLPFLRLLQAQLFPKLSNRDYIRFDEARMKAFFLAWLSLREYQLVLSELEHIGGYSDLVLVPSPHFPWATHCVLLELKYLKLKDFERGGLEAVEAKLLEGEQQLLSYANDPRLALLSHKPWTRRTVVFAARREIYHRAPGEPTQRLEQVEEEYE